MAIYRSTSLLILSLVLCGAQTPPPSLTGAWHLEMVFPDATSIKLDLKLQQTGTSITGTVATATGENPVTGIIDGSNVTLTETVTGGSIVFKGKQVNANTMQGTVDAPPFGTGNWTATR